MDPVTKDGQYRSRETGSFAVEKEASFLLEVGRNWWCGSVETL